MVPCSFITKSEEAVLRNAFDTTPSVTSPGTMNRAYGTPSTSRRREPRENPNTTK